MSEPLPPRGGAGRRGPVSEWVDLEYPEDTYRSFSGERRGFERGDCASRGQYVEAYGLQNPDGTLEELTVRAEVDGWVAQ